MNKLNKIYCNYMKKKYPDWEDNEYNRGAVKFVWGVKSVDSASCMHASFYTYNCIAIYYDRKTKKYILDIAPSPNFLDDYCYDVKYLTKLLDYFTVFMTMNNYDTDYHFDNFGLEPEIFAEADSIMELYTMFRIFVEGYSAVYGGKEDA